MARRATAGSPERIRWSTTASEAEARPSGCLVRTSSRSGYSCFRNGTTSSSVALLLGIGVANVMPTNTPTHAATRITPIRAVFPRVSGQAGLASVLSEIIVFLRAGVRPQEDPANQTDDAAT